MAAVNKPLAVFKIPLILKPEARKTIQARILEQECLIKFPEPWLKKQKYLAFMVDRVYWRLLAQLQASELATKTAELNRLYFDFNYREVRYHRQFRRWGSCSALRNINLSHRLIGAPDKLGEYVILHELAHLQHLNHGREFWGLIKTTGYDPKIFRREIELYGRSWQNAYYQWCHQLLKSVNSGVGMVNSQP